MFNAKEFLKDFSIKYVEQGHKHCRKGWVQTSCPFCTGNPGYHLGFDLQHNYWSCWRCGFHSILKVVHHFTNLDWDVCKSVIRQYNDGTGYVPNEQDKRKASKVRLPSGVTKLKAVHKKYLKSRNFNPSTLEKTWDLCGTGHLGPYSFRIIAPIYYNKTLVSYQGRDFTEQSELKYKACSSENEMIDHKHLLYGLDQAQDTACILVEGITDVWRMGPGAVASFGIKTKPNQLLLLAEKFKKVFIMFDDDPQAVNSAEDIGEELAMMGTETFICTIKGDPGELSQKKADKYKKKLIG